MCLNHYFERIIWRFKKAHPGVEGMWWWWSRWSLHPETLTRRVEGASGTLQVDLLTPRSASPSWETLRSPSAPRWSTGSTAVLFEGGELPAEEFLYKGPDLVGFRAREGLQHSFTPAGERVETLGVNLDWRIFFFFFFGSSSIWCCLVSPEIAAVMQKYIWYLWKSSPACWLLRLFV